MSEFVFICLMDFVIIINACELSRSQKVQIVDLIFNF